MYKRYLTFLLIAIWIGYYNFLSAQIKVTFVKDSITDRPIFMAFVKFLEHNKPNGRLYGYTDETGFLRAQSLYNAQYVKLTHDEYKEKTVPVILTNDTLCISLVPNNWEKQPSQSSQNKPNMDSATIALPEISVTGHRKMVRQTAKGSILDLTKIREANFWQLSDALQQIPGVEVNPVTNSITYQGKAVALQENGMSPGNLLMETPANQYSTVELVLYDPKSRFEGPILNLVKVKKEEPYWGYLQSWGSLNAFGIRPMIGIHRGVQTLEIFASFSASFNPSQTSDGWMEVPQNQFYREYTNKSRSKGHNTLPSPTLRYTLDFKKHLIDLVLVYGKNKNNFHRTSKETEYEQNILSNNYTQKLNRDMSATNKQLEIGYLYTINKNNRLNAKLNIISPENDSNETLSSIGSESFIPFISYKKSIAEERTENFVSVSYEHQSQQLGTLEGGSKYFNRLMDKSLVYIPNQEDGTEKIEEAHYLNKYYYLAAFASWAKQFNRYSFFLVLKQDYSQDRIPTSGDLRFSYSSFSPYLSVRRSFAKHGLGLVLKYNEQRPRLQELDPVIEPGSNNGRIILTGNPNLKTYKVYSTTVSYTSTFFKKMDTSLSFNYEYTKDPIQQYRKLIDDTNIMELTFLNMGWNQRLYSNASLQYPLTRQWRISCEISMDWNKTHLNSNKNSNYQSANGSVSSEYTIKSWQFRASGNYYKSAGFQTSSSERWGYSLYVRYTSPPKWNFSLGISNPIPYYQQYSSTTNADGYQSHYDSKTRQFNVNLSVMYRFGKTKYAKSTKRIVVDDM